ncbi:exported hypothetical protein [Syntrophobacter sp. SbD1]|nr:exported hypothetical protein [Syntrophobacter sp. SbD1]
MLRGMAVLGIVALFLCALAANAFCEERNAGESNCMELLAELLKAKGIIGPDEAEALKSKITGNESAESVKALVGLLKNKGLVSDGEADRFNQLLANKPTQAREAAKAIPIAPRDQQYAQNTTENVVSEVKTDSHDQDRTEFASALGQELQRGKDAVNFSTVDWYFTPSATLSQSYNSNLQFVTVPPPGSTKGDFITSFTPVVSVTGETEKAKFQFDTVTSGQVYLQNPKFDTVNTYTTAGLTEFWSPRFSTSANLGLVHDYTLEDQLQQSGIIAAMTERFMYSCGLGDKYDLSESLSLALNGSYAKSVFPSNVLPGSDDYEGSISPVWSVSERNNIGMTSSFSYINYSNDTTIKSVTEMLFWQRAFSETMNFKLSGGYYYSSLDFLTPTVELIPVIPPFLYTPVTVLVPTTGTAGGFIYSAELKKDWSERFSTTFSAGSQQYNDVNARSWDSTTISGGASYKLSELTTFNFMAKYYMNDQLGGGIEKIDYYIISPSIEMILTEKIVLRLNASYENELDKNPGGLAGPITTVDRYRTWIDLVWQWPRFLASD